METEAQEIQEQYDNVRGTIQMVVLTQRLARFQEAKLLKEKVDAAHQKEAILKVHVQPWIDEAFLITAGIEKKLAQM